MMASRFMQKHPIGMDIAENRICLVQLKPDASEDVVAAWMQRATEGATADLMEQGNRLVSLIRQMAQAGGFRGRRLSAHVPPAWVQAFPVTINVRAPEEIESALIREARAHLSFPVEAAVVDYSSLQRLSDDTYRAMMIAVERKLIDRLIAIVGQAGLVLEIIDVRLASLIRLHRRYCPAVDNPLILCHIGEQQSLLSIVTADTVLAQRDIAWGVAPLIEKIETNFELATDAAHARILLDKIGLRYDDHINSPAGKGTDEESPDEDAQSLLRAVCQLIGPQVDTLIDELHRLIGYVRAETDHAMFDGAYLYGYARTIGGLESYLARRLNLVAQCVNPLTNIRSAGETQYAEQAPGAAIDLSLGLAMRAMS